MTGPTIHLCPIDELSSPQLADVQTRSFAGYFVPIALTAETFDRDMRTAWLDPSLSWVAFAEAQAVACMFVERADAVARVAAMAVVPSHRGLGIGSQLLSQLVRQLPAAITAIELEVIEQALLAYDGALIVVSHDPVFIQTIGCAREIRL